MNEYNQIKEIINIKLKKYLPLEDEIPLFFDKPSDNKLLHTSKINNLVLSGGGIKGFGHIGALKALEEYNLINNLTTIAGTSVGAIIGMLYSIGYKSKDMIEFMEHFNLKGIKKIDFMKILELFGVDDGEKIELLLKKLLKNKNIHENITLIETFKLTGIELIVASVCVNDRKVKYISYKSNPHLELIKAVRMSFSVPFYFTPVEYNDELYIDGGCIDNFPIHLFDNEQENTIGIYLYSSVDKINKFENIESYGVRIIQCLIEGFDQMSTRNYSKSTILIDLETINMLNFDLDKSDINKLYQKGYTSTIKYINENNLKL
jgi:NTE family protein